METIRTLHKSPLLTVGDGRFLRVEQHAVQFADGTVIDDWPWIITPEFVTITAVLNDGRILCFRQAKYAAGGLTFGIPGGYLEPGEDPLACAQRELLEETGCSATHWTALGNYAVDANRGNGRAHFFLATGVSWQQPKDADDLEELETLLLSADEVRTALAAGEFKVLPWAACVALALLHMAAAVQT